MKGMGVEVCGESSHVSDADRIKKEELFRSHVPAAGSGTAYPWSQDSSTNSLKAYPSKVFLVVSQEAICSSLEEYNHHIEELKQEMEEATESAKRIRGDIQEMRNKYGVVDSQEKCAACDFPLLNRSFYLFLCGHMFHYDCLLQVKGPF